MSARIALPPNQEQSSLIDRVSGFATLLTAAALLRWVRFGRIVSLVRVCKRCCVRPSTIEEAAAATTAIRSASVLYLGRVACLESSLATVLVCALHRREVDWYIGVRTLPYASHAWIEVGGRTVGEFPETIGAYKPILVV